MANISKGEARNNEFFLGRFGDLWKQMVPPAYTQAEIDLIIDQASLAPGSRILDLMCGFGRHSLELGRRGIHTVSIDYVPNYVEEINRTAQEESLPVLALQGSVLDVEPEGMFDAVLWMGNSFAFFEKHNNESVLEMASRHLKPGGRLIIDSWMIAEAVFAHFKPQSWSQFGDTKYLLDYTYKHNPSRIESEQTLVFPGGTDVRHAVDYIYTLDQTREMLAKAGLQMQELYSNPRKRPWKLGDATLYIVAEKF